MEGGSSKIHYILLVEGRGCGASQTVPICSSGKKQLRKKVKRWEVNCFIKLQRNKVKRGLYCFGSEL
jgi:hypothetical protein